MKPRFTTESQLSTYEENKSDARLEGRRRRRDPGEAAEPLPRGRCDPRAGMEAGKRDIFMLFREKTVCLWI